MSVIVIIGFLLIVGSICGLLAASARRSVHVALALVGLVGIVLLVVEHRQAASSQRGQSEMVRQECHSHANAIRRQIATMQDAKQGELDPKALDKWHQLDAGAVALWSLCVGPTCRQPTNYAAKPEIMKEAADMLDSAHCEPIP